MQWNRGVDVRWADDGVHNQFVLFRLVQPGLTVHGMAELVGADGVRINEVAGQDDAVCKVDDEPVAVIRRDRWKVSGLWVRVSRPNWNGMSPVSGGESVLSGMAPPM